MASGTLLSKAVTYPLAIAALTLFLTLSASLEADAKEKREAVKVAYIGDQNIKPGSHAALKLIKDEGADLAVVVGDLDYVNKPKLYAQMMDETLGEDFPYFYIIGNHDIEKWDGKNGYQDRLERRLKKQKITWKGELGVRSAIKYKGLSFVMTSPGIRGKGHADYIKKRFSNDPSPWRVCLFHKNQAKMQAGSKGNEAGWKVYEACREAGAMTVSGHAHVYSRTHPLKSMVKQKVASKSKRVVLKKGQTIAIVSGLGGDSKNRRRHLPDDPWWASVYSAEYGALFCTYFSGKDPRKADCYFKDIKGRVIDEFRLISEVR